MNAEININVKENVDLNIKKPKKNPLFIIAGILVAISAVVGAIYLLFFFAVNLLGIASGNSYTSVISLILSMTPSIFGILLIIAAAVLLIVKKDSFVSLIPLGLLTSAACSSVISPFLSYFFNNYGAEFHANYYSLVLGAICTAFEIAVTVFVVVAALTFCKKVRFVPLLILAIIILGGALIGSEWYLISMALNVENYLYILEDLDTAESINFVLRVIIAPAFSAVQHCIMGIGVLLAAIGSIVSMKKNS